MDSEIQEQARGGLDISSGSSSGDTKPWGLAFLSGLAFVLGGVAGSQVAVAVFAGAAVFAGGDFVGLALAVVPLIAVVAGIKALMGRFGVSPVWPILGFVIAIAVVLTGVFLLWAATWQRDCQEYWINPDGSRGECIQGWM